MDINIKMLIIIDLPITKICRQEIEINPLQKSLEDPNYESPQFCLSLLILLIPYTYLLYLYINSLYFINRKNLFRELDGLDLAIIVISMLRLLSLFVFPLVEHYGGLVFLALLAYAWQVVVAFIFLRFLVDQIRVYRAICGIFIAFHFLYCIVANNGINQPLQEQKNTIKIPLLLPWLILALSVTAISVLQLHLIQKSLENNILNAIITVQLKNRRSFVFMTLACSWLSLIMRKFPDVFKPLQGVVLYFIISEWVNMAVIYRFLLDRIVRSNQEEDSEMNQGLAPRNSGLIVVEMHNYGSRK